MRYVGRARGNWILVKNSQVERIRPPVADGHGPPDFALAARLAVIRAIAIGVCHGDQANNIDLPLLLMLFDDVVLSEVRRSTLEPTNRERCHNLESYGS